MRRSWAGAANAMAGNSANRIALDEENVRDIGATYTVCYANATITGNGFCTRAALRRSNNPEIPDRPPRRDGFGGGDDGVGVDAVVAVEILDRAGLAEMLDTERPHAVAMDGAEPGQGRRMTVEHADDAAMPRHVGEQPLDVGAGVNQTALARPARRGPAGIEAVRRRDGQKPDVAAILRHQANGLDRLRRHRAGISDDDLAVRAWRAQPIGAVDDGLAQRRRHRPLDLLDRTGGQAQIDRAPGLVAQPVALGGLALGILVGVALNVIEREGQDGGELIDEGRLERGKAVLRDADQRLGDRLVRAAFRRQRDA